MCLLFETIRIENGVPLHLKWHEQRMERAGREFWPEGNPAELKNRIVVPAAFSTGTVRCNILYGREIGEIRFTPWSKRVIRSLKLVDCNSIDYHVKFLDRTPLENLLATRGDCDDILIVKDGLVTDTSMSNIIFFDGQYQFMRDMTEGYLSEIIRRWQRLPMPCAAHLLCANRYGGS